MKTKLRLVPILFLFIFTKCTTYNEVQNTNNKPQNTISISIEQLCNTWISFESRYYDRMQPGLLPRIIENENKDTIAFLKDGTFIKHNKSERRIGLWQFISDTEVSCNITSPVSKNATIRFLSDSVLTISIGAGKEGETMMTMYKRTSSKINE
jgi:hypothetical protein